MEKCINLVQDGKVLLASSLINNLKYFEAILKSKTQGCNYFPE